MKSVWVKRKIIFNTFFIQEELREKEAERIHLEEQEKQDRIVKKREEKKKQQEVMRYLLSDRKL